MQQKTETVGGKKYVYYLLEVTVSVQRGINGTIAATHTTGATNGYVAIVGGTDIYQFTGPAAFGLYLELYDASSNIQLNNPTTSACADCGSVRSLPFGVFAGNPANTKQSAFSDIAQAFYSPPQRCESGQRRQTQHRRL